MRCFATWIPTRQMGTKHTLPVGFITSVVVLFKTFRGDNHPPPHELRTLVGHSVFAKNQSKISTATLFARPPYEYDGPTHVDNVLRETLIFVFMSFILFTLPMHSRHSHTNFIYLPHIPVDKKNPDIFCA